MSNALAVTITATGTAVARRSRVTGVYFVAGATAGSIVLKDGGASGTTRLDLATAASSYGFVPLTGNGILMMTDIYATLTNITSLTVFYD